MSYTTKLEKAGKLTERISLPWRRRKRQPGTMGAPPPPAPSPSHNAATPEPAAMIARLQEARQSSYKSAMKRQAVAKWIASYFA